MRVAKVIAFSSFLALLARVLLKYNPGKGRGVVVVMSPDDCGGRIARL